MSLSAYDARWSRRHFTNLPTDLEIDRVCSRKAQTANQLLQVKLINFSKVGEPLVLKIMNFAHNDSGDQAFIQGNAKDQQAFNRPLNVGFGADGCAWVPDYGAVRDLGADTHFEGPRPMVRCFKFRELVSFGGSARPDRPRETIIDLM